MEPSREKRLADATESSECVCLTFASDVPVLSASFLRQPFSHLRSLAHAKTATVDLIMRVGGIALKFLDATVALDIYDGERTCQTHEHSYVKCSIPSHLHVSSDAREFVSTCSPFTTVLGV